MAYSSNSIINGLEAKATPVDADVLVVGDSADSNRAKKTTWAQIKTVLGVLFAPLTAPTFLTSITTNYLTASEIVISDASKKIVSAPVATYPSLTELSYVKGVTSALQTQITAKAPSTAPTFATSITGSYLTASQILGTDASKNIVSLAVATYPSLTELTYLKGVTSAIQTQLNAISPAVFTNGTTTKDAADASTTQNIAHGLGKIPKYVKITALPSSDVAMTGKAFTVYNGTTQSSVSVWGNNVGGGGRGYGVTFTINSAGANTGDQTGVVTFDATNIIITWTKTSSPTGTHNLLWEAEA